MSYAAAMLIETSFRHTWATAAKTLWVALSSWTRAFYLGGPPLLLVAAFADRDTMWFTVAAAVIPLLLVEQMRQARKQGEVHLVLNDHGVAATVRGQTAFYPWPTVLEITRRFGQWNMRVMKNCVLPLPEAALTPEQNTELERFFHASPAPDPASGRS